nr:hypothetical protein [Tanacetum cinerariifolium]
MIAYLTKSNNSEGFNHIIDFLNGSSIKYALTVNPNIYVSCIKQFWTTVAIKKVNDFTRLQALVDKKKVVVTEALIRDILCLDNAEGVDCLPNKEIFTELARMGYEKPSTKLMFYKAFFSSKGFSGAETPLFEGMLVVQEVRDEGEDEVLVRDVNAKGAAEGVGSAADDVVPTADEEPSIPSPTPPTPPPQPSQDIPSTSQERMNRDQDVDVVLEEAEDKDVANVVKDVQDAESTYDQGRKAKSQAKIYKIDMGHAQKTITDVVTVVSDPLTAASITINVVEAQAPAAILTAAPSRRRKGVVIRDPEESSSSTIILAKTKSKDMGKGILVEEPKPLKKQAQIKQDEKYARELEVELNRNIDWDEVINHVNKKAKEDPAVKKYQALKRKPQTEAQARKNMIVYLKNVAEQIEEEGSRALKRHNETPAEKAAKRQKLDGEVEKLKRHLQIVSNEEDDVYTEATPFALKVPVVDYEIYNEHNKPYYKIKRADGSHQLYLSFISMLKNFDREDLEALWKLVKEIFATTKPKNFFDDFLLITLGSMFEKPDIHAQIWKNQRSVHI